MAHEIFTEAQREALHETRSGALTEAQYLKRGARYPKPYTEKHLREILVDCQMRLSGAADFGHGLVHDKVWDESDRRDFESEMEDAINTIREVYRHLDEG